MPRALPPSFKADSFDVEFLSPSQFSRLRLCPASGLRLVAAFQELPVGPAALVGLVVHRVLDAARDRPPDIPPTEWAMARFVAEVTELESQLAQDPSTAHLVPLSGTMSSIEWANRRAVALSLAPQVTPTARRPSGEPAGTGERPPDPRAHACSEWPFRHGDLRLKGVIDRIEPRGRQRLVVHDFKSGAVTDGKDAVKEAYQWQLRLYAVVLEELAPGWALELRVVGRDGSHVVDWTGTLSTATRTELSQVLERIDGGTVATPSPTACRFCPRRALCEAYLETAPEWWRQPVAPGERLPPDIWGEIQAITPRRGGSFDVELRDAAGRFVDVTGVSARHGMDDVQQGDVVYFFDFAPSGLAFRSSHHPRNFHEARPGEATAWSATVFRKPGPPGRP